MFALYLVQCASKTSRNMTGIIFCALCILYVLSTVTFVADLVKFVLEEVPLQFHSSTSSLQLPIDSRQTIIPSRLTIIQATASGCCDFLAQSILVRINHCTYHGFYSPKSSKIYRCWIVWRRNICVVILPLILAIAYLGQSIYYLYFPVIC